MFVLRAKCKLSDASAECRCGAWPAHRRASRSVPTAAGQRLEPRRRRRRRPDPAARRAGRPTTRCRAGCGPATRRRRCRRSTPDAWRWLEVRSGVARIVAATAEQFVPQMVNFELGRRRQLPEGLLSRAGSRRAQPVPRHAEAAGAVVSGDTPLQPGDEVFHNADPGPAGGHGRAGRVGRGERQRRWSRSSSRRWPAARCTPGRPTARGCRSAGCPTRYPPKPPDAVAAGPG